MDEEQLQPPKKHHTELHKKHTVASEHRCVQWVPQVDVVNDSLDTALLSVYSHSGLTFPRTNEVCMQKETFILCLKKQLNNIRSDHKVEKLFRNHPLKMGGLIGERKDINSIKLGLVGSHISQTNHGYSRKEDGTFYNY
ncbi:uncharacterized protein C1orf194 homolog [Acyrthosiphon pisum]|uniref:Uncharacterized protein n=1 Tax=Acyrthosiphon pisum TaxID=7029 RepID=A0A8R1W608_ACYPI|nr:uncharacterized protein C1orf194 homolog [Acyrthosiphon pisum]|eukprot:XP_003245361.2 PREDICTED: uncharacterized protein C1orf194 homolog [Acyrthosiphon pisum]